MSYQPAARARVVAILLAVASAGGLIESAEVGELDINPVIVGPDSVVAVDAVVHPSDAADSETVAAKAARRRAALSGLGALFDPATVAAIGSIAAPAAIDRSGPAWPDGGCCSAASGATRVDRLPRIRVTALVGPSESPVCTTLAGTPATVA